MAVYTVWSTHFKYIIYIKKTSIKFTHFNEKCHSFILSSAYMLMTYFCDTELYTHLSDNISANLVGIAHQAGKFYLSNGI